MEYSILMSCYIKDNPLDLRAALESIKLQTMPASEIVLVEDGPLTEELYRVIDEYKNELPIKSVRIETNKGLGNALKTGVEACSHDIIARADADDICLASRMEKQISFMTENPRISVVGSWIEEFLTLPGDLRRIRKAPETAAQIALYSKSRNPLNHQTVVFRKEAVQNCGSYKPMLYFEDYYLWMRMLKQGLLMHNLQEPLMHARVGNDMLARRHGYKYSRFEYKFFKRLYNEHMLKPMQFVTVILSRIPLRLLPKPFLRWFYLLLRKNG